MKKLKSILLIKYELAKNFSLNESDFDEEGRIIVDAPYLARLLSYKIKEKIGLNAFPGKLMSFAILTGIFDYIIERLEIEFLPRTLIKANNFLDSEMSSFEYSELFKSYSSYFFSRKTFDATEERMKGISFIKNLILLFLSNQNSAVNDIKILFDDTHLIDKTKYLEAIKLLEQFLDKYRLDKFNNKSLIEFLFEPLLISPDSLENQLSFIKENWKHIIPAEFIDFILKSIDLIKEDEKIFHRSFGPGESKVPTFSLEELLGFGDKFRGNYYPIQPAEDEKFTPDIDWMPKVILLAKNIYVWLYQLSRKYNREIKRLDQIPDEELDLLASYNFNALWLIGIWERSPASLKIKRLSGNPEALASAYSIYDYVIATELGGEEAFQNLNERCQRRGIRLACDIVPNHMGIYSRWIIEHPDYFIQTDYSPFPTYTFTGPDLSEHPDFQIRIEDKYWTRQDAAVVFQFIENKTGKVRYIYHGNDGTNMPWNDTAQLNLLKPEVREALVQLIFKIARKFSIIRLDAAMTLTQKHYQRLWFPVPGTGDSIPSRIDFAMFTDEFLKHYPKEFWREVVDRINIEKPDTLLLAEAFWLMEGYFVRTLGMHRVYNSAFMNMLKNEENAKYRLLIKNTLVFNPEILKRYVNFLSNPDEETAINQFGDGDKYFGCAVTMVTMPGLPMFAHGQIEGLREKYGHEYSRAYYDEQPNEYLIERHKSEIFPLMKKRYLFSQVENFEFYDFKNKNGEVIENVFAYSNLIGNERALIVYNNSYATYRGFVDYSCPKNYGSSENDGNKKLIVKSIGSALGIQNDVNYYYIFREMKTNLEYIRRGDEFHNKKFELELSGYDYKVFIDFVEIYDVNGEISEFYEVMKDKCYASLNRELIEFKYDKLLNEFFHNFNKVRFEKLLTSTDENIIQSLISDIRNSIHNFSEKFKLNKSKYEYELLKIINEFVELNSSIQKLRNRKTKPLWLRNILEMDFSLQSIICNLQTIFLAKVLNGIQKNSQLEDNVRIILVDKLLQKFATAYSEINLTFISNLNEKIEISLRNGVLKRTSEYSLNVFEILRDSMRKINEDAERLLGVNEYLGEKYFKKEKMEYLIALIGLILLLSEIKNKKLKANELINHLKEFSNLKRDILKFMIQSDYKLNKFTEILASKIP